MLLGYEWYGVTMVLRRAMSGGRDLSPSLGESTGLKALAEAIVRRLTTTLGALPNHPDYGFNIDELIGTTKTDSFIRQQILGQVFLEEDVADARCRVERTTAGLSISIIVFSPDGEFPLTISVDSLSADVIIPADI
jgi:phage baseplate assembly protein W